MEIIKDDLKKISKPIINQTTPFLRKNSPISGDFQLILTFTNSFLGVHWKLGKKTHGNHRVHSQKDFQTHNQSMHPIDTERRSHK